MRVSYSSFKVGKYVIREGALHAHSTNWQVVVACSCEKQSVISSCSYLEYIKELKSWFARREFSTKAFTNSSNDLCVVLCGIYIVKFHWFVVDPILIVPRIDSSRSLSSVLLILSP